MAALKTLLNSWCTRGRYHDESAENCIFGCAGALDDITHYVCCPSLWSISAQAAGLHPAANVEVQILLRDPSAANLAQLVIAFSIYHAVKLGHATNVADAIRSGDFVALTALARSIADAQWLKIGLWRASDTPVSAPPMPCASAVEPAASEQPSAETQADENYEDAPAPVTPRVVCFVSTPEWWHDSAGQ